MATIKKQAAEIKYMPGTQGTPYFPYARKGNVLLGVRLQAVERGDRYGADGMTYFTVRLRSAPENGLFAEEDKAKTVVKLIQNPANLWDAWPAVVWEKKDASRASTTVGVFENGSFRSKDPAALKPLLDAIGDGKLADKFTDHLITLADEKNLICRRSDLIAFLDEGIKPVLAAIMQNMGNTEKFADFVKDNAGTVSMHAALIKKLFPDKPDGDDEGEAEVADIEADQD